MVRLARQAEVKSLFLRGKSLFRETIPCSGEENSLLVSGRLAARESTNLLKQLEFVNVVVGFGSIGIGEFPLRFPC